MPFLGNSVSIRGIDHAEAVIKVNRDLNFVTLDSVSSLAEDFIDASVRPVFSCEKRNSWLVYGMRRPGCISDPAISMCS